VVQENQSSSSKLGGTKDNHVQQMYGDVDFEKNQVWLDAIKQEPKQRVQAYYDKLEKLFARGKIKEAE
jgi:hypothetical protein